jgi:hypothetical protein
MPSRKSERGQPTTNDRSEGKTILRSAFYFTAFRTVKQWFPVIIRVRARPNLSAADNGQKIVFKPNLSAIKTNCKLQLSYTFPTRANAAIFTPETR